MNNSSEHQESVYEELLKRVGEANPRPRLEPVKRLAAYLGDPQLTFPVIHVAGTNGKTSTSRAIEVLLRAHGIRTGLLTSPHLINFEERIRIDGEEVSQETLQEAWTEMQPALKMIDQELIAEGQSAITFFEALVVLAFTVFADAPVEVAVVEVGMGGEWDATNIVDSVVSVFTPIGLDHTAILGTDLVSIAKTKAGIIKTDSAVISAIQDPDVATVLRSAAQSEGSSFYLLGENYRVTNDIGAVGGRMFSATGITGHKYEHLLIPLYGRHQTENALTAIAAVESFFGGTREIDGEVIADAFANLTSPGRMHAISTSPLMLVDAAHNPHGAERLVEGIQEHFVWDELLLVLGVFDDKDSAGIVQQLLPLATKVYTTTIASERSLEAWDLTERIQELGIEKPVESFEGSVDALIEARAWASEADGRIVLVAGSVMLAGEALKYAIEEGWQSEEGWHGEETDIN